LAIAGGHHRGAHRRVEQRAGPAAVHLAHRVVLRLGGMADEARHALVGGDDAEAERGADGRLSDGAVADGAQELETGHVHGDLLCAKLATARPGARYGIRTARAPAAKYDRSMKSYGQFCSVARALELLGERWTLLVVRELLCGGRTFGDIRRGIPRISRTMLPARLRELLHAEVIVRRADGYEAPPARPAPPGVAPALGPPRQT